MDNTGESDFKVTPAPMHSDAWFDDAFTRATTGEPYDLPADIRAAATRIVRSYGIRGICDPMYIANVIARETGRGDGQGKFFDAGTPGARVACQNRWPGERT